MRSGLDGEVGGSHGLILSVGAMPFTSLMKFSNFKGLISPNRVIEHLVIDLAGNTFETPAQCK